MTGGLILRLLPRAIHQLKLLPRANTTSHFCCPRVDMSRYSYGGSLICYFHEEYIVNFFAWVLVNMWIQFLKKNFMWPTFQKLTFCKGLYGENDGLLIWGKRHEKHIFKLQSDESLCWMLSRSMKQNYTLSMFLSSNRRNFEDSGKVQAFSVSEIYQSTAVQHYQPTLIMEVSSESPRVPPPPG